MSLLDLALPILQEHRETTLQHAGPAIRKRCGFVSEPLTAASRLDTDDGNGLVRHEGMECADGVGSSPYTRYQHIREAASLLEHLCTGLAANDGLQLANQVRIRMRSDSGADQVVGIQGVGNPVAQCFVDSR